MLAMQVRKASEGVEEGWGASHTDVVKQVADGGEAQALETLRSALLVQFLI